MKDLSNAFLIAIYIALIFLVIRLCIYPICMEIYKDNKNNKVMNLQEEFDKLSKEEQWDFLVRNLDEQTAIDAVLDNDVRLDVVANAYPYDAVQEFILDCAKGYGVVIDYEATRDE